MPRSSQSCREAMRSGIADAYQLADAMNRVINRMAEIAQS